MRYKISNYDYLLAKLSEVSADDLSRPWHEYPCMEWDRYLNPRKMGLVWVPERGRKIRISRLALESVIGKIPEGEGALHHCDNPPCFRPIHLFAGTQDDNMKDAMKKDRMRKGSAAVISKLTEEMVTEILALEAVGVPKNALAKKFGVSDSTIWQIFAGKSWKHVQDPSGKPYSSRIRGRRRWG